MIKRYIKAITCGLVISANSYAGSVEVPKDMFSGFFVTAQMGGVISLFRLDSYFSYHTAGTTSQTGSAFTQKANLDTGRPLFDGTAGWGFKCGHHPFYLGLLGFAERYSTRVEDRFGYTAPFNNNSQIEINKVTLENAYGVQAKLGYLSSENSMLFLQVGAVWSELNGFLQNQFQAVANSFASDRIKRTIHGVRVGLGIEYASNSVVHWLINYQFSFYGHAVNLAAEQLVSNGTQDFEYITKYSAIQTHTFLGGVSFYFSL